MQLTVPWGVRQRSGRFPHDSRRMRHCRRSHWAAELAEQLGRRADRSESLERRSEDAEGWPDLPLPALPCDIQRPRPRTKPPATRWRLAAPANPSSADCSTCPSTLRRQCPQQPKSHFRRFDECPDDLWRKPARTSSRGFRATHATNPRYVSRQEACRLHAARQFAWESKRATGESNIGAILMPIIEVKMETALQRLADKARWNPLEYTCHLRKNGRQGTAMRRGGQQFDRFKERCVY